jgi:hypothetical protein
VSHREWVGDTNEVLAGVSNVTMSPGNLWGTKLNSCTTTEHLPLLYQILSGQLASEWRAVLAPIFDTLCVELVGMDEAKPPDFGSCPLRVRDSVAGKTRGWAGHKLRC